METVPALSGTTEKGAMAPWFYRRFLKLNYRAIEPQKRGFNLSHPDRAERIRTIGTAFLDGYHAALNSSSIEEMATALCEVANEFRGFAFEGAGMGVAMIDYLSPWRPKFFPEFVESTLGDEHVYMLHVGMGWAVARLPGSPERAARRSRSIFAWLVLDGYGFHEGFFHHRRYLGSSRQPRSLSELGTRVFDQGLGRSFWFVFASDAPLIAQAIGELALSRHADLWSGVGLACAYAGGAGTDNTRQLIERCGEFRAQLAQGASFGAKARQRGRNLNEHTERTCQLLCEMSAEEAAAVTDTALSSIPQEHGLEAYEAWRRKIINHYAGTLSHV